MHEPPLTRPDPAQELPTCARANMHPQSWTATYSWRARSQTGLRLFRPCSAVRSREAGGTGHREEALQRRRDQGNAATRTRRHGGLQHRLDTLLPHDGVREAQRAAKRTGRGKETAVWGWMTRTADAVVQRRLTERRGDRKRTRFGHGCLINRESSLKWLLFS